MMRYNRAWLIFLISALLASNLTTYYWLSPPPYYGDNIYWGHYSQEAYGYFDKWGWSYSDGDFNQALSQDYYIYVIAHGGSYGFVYEGELITSAMVKDIMGRRLPPLFVMQVSCEGGSNLGPGSLCEAYGASVYMSLVNTSWWWSINWAGFQSHFLKGLDNGLSFNESFNRVLGLERYKIFQGHVILSGPGIDTTVETLRPPAYDLNNDARVNILDMIILAGHWTG